MNPEEEAFDATALTHNRPRLDKYGLTGRFFAAVVARAVQAGLTSDEHFTVDGTLIESFASIKSFQPKPQPQDDHGQDKTDDGNGPDGDDYPRDPGGPRSRNVEQNFHGQRRTNATHASTTDPEARLYKKSCGTPARLTHLGHAITENRHGLVVAVTVTDANGRAEHEAAVTLLDKVKATPGLSPKTLGADRGYDSGPLLVEIEQRGVTPHVAQRIDRSGAVPLGPDLPPKVAARQRMRERLTGPAYQASQRCRKKVEEVYGWMKTVAGLSRTRLVGRWKLVQQVEIAAAAFNRVRLRKLLPA